MPRGVSLKLAKEGLGAATKSPEAISESELAENAKLAGTFIEEIDQRVAEHGRFNYFKYKTYIEE